MVGSGALGSGFSHMDESHFLDKPPPRETHGSAMERNSRRAVHPPRVCIAALPGLEYVEDFEDDDDDNHNPDDIERVHDYLFSFTVSLTVMLFSTLRTFATLPATSPARLFWSLLSAKPLN